MWGPPILFTSLVSLATSSIGAELSPFHTSIFSADVSVALSVRSVTASRSREYDYDVTIGLTERLSNGRTIFIDHGNHDARVKCLPGKVFVGGKEYLPLPSQATLDWKEDLVESLCTRPVS
ncbi:hypothetical protein AS026_30620 [Rhizobium altiplani]|uniref:Uncharacterized protein n=1 Tax=Rhizobium altiplani TaxID=1864509 RepID=A0A120FQ53_9HYPH|nr:hypothetical protein AS026_30620 [Rhizobium altiplani]